MTRIGTGRLRTIGLLLTALLLAVGVMGAVSTPANASGGTADATASETTDATTAARTAARRVNYGAIALNVKTGWSGWSYDKKNKKKAKKAAVKHCKKRTPSGVNKAGCKAVVWVSNGCAAIAVKIKNNRITKVGWGVAFKKGKAKKLAKKKAGKKKAKIHTWVCTTRYR